METKRPTQLAIDGKVISIEKIGEKSLAQWKAQLKLAGLTVEDERAEFLYTELRKQIERAEQKEQAAQEQTNNQQ
jgi:hypothetical protein